MTRIASAITMIVLMRGSMIVKKRCRQLAPSSVAAFSWSSGTPTRPASRIRNISGVHCQMSAIITATSASVGSESQAMRTSMPVSAERMPLNGPPDWNSMKNM